MSDTLARLRLDYRSAFLGYLSRRGETQLRSAYEIGRGAIAAGVGLLDLVETHNVVTLELLGATPDGPERLDVAQAAAAFLVEMLASSEMTQRGFLEASRPSRPRLDPDTGLPLGEAEV